MHATSSYRGNRPTNTHTHPRTHPQTGPITNLQYTAPLSLGRSVTSCRRAAAMICPRPGLQRKRAAAALSQAGRAGPDQPIRAMQPAGRPHTPPADRMYATDVRQTDVRHHRLMPPGRGHSKTRNSNRCAYVYFLCV